VLQRKSREASGADHDGDHCHCRTYDEVLGERDRVTVTLATGIPEDVVRSINLDYLDPADVDVEAWKADPDALVVPQASEVIFRLR
jgi:hypothetical protein